MTINETLSQLRTLLLQMRSQLDQADAHVPEINNVVRSIAELQIVAERTLLGHVVHMQEYSPQTQPVDSGIVLQAALCLLYTSPSPRDATLSRMPSSA